MPPQGVLGWFAATPGVSQTPAFPGAPLPFGSVEEKANTAQPARH
jgi:hypothetical protein